MQAGCFIPLLSMVGPIALGTSYTAGRKVGLHWAPTATAAWVPSNCTAAYTASGLGHAGPCLFDRPTIASEMRKLQNSARAARNRELSEREVKLSPVPPARTAAGGAPHGNSTSDDGPASLCIVYV